MPPQPKKDAVLRAAVGLFSRHGFRKASVDEIAQQAGVAKPTLYAHFENKQALFAAVCEHVGGEMLAAARAARQAGTLVERVAGVLSAKFTTTFELVLSSPYAHELLETQEAAARRHIDATTVKFEALLTAVLKDAAHAGELDLETLGLSAAALTRVLMQAGHGASYGARSAEQHRANLTSIVRALLRAGLRDGGAPKKKARR